MPNTLRKSERLDKKKVIEKMFAGGSRSFSVFPLRVVYLPVEELEAPVSILVSVSKRRFKRAVKRNRVKRQIREAYPRMFPCSGSCMCLWASRRGCILHCRSSAH